MKKKVLIITYYWPPSGGIAVQRCLKFAKYLRNFGWEPIIYTTKNAQYLSYDTSFLKDIPEGITILKRRIIEPFNLFRILSGRKKSYPENPVYARSKKKWLIDNIAIWIRGNIFIPDARFLWIKPSVRFLKKYLKKNPVNAILTDGPPHTNTVIGCKLSKDLNIPWLADFQDPWTQVDYYELFKIGGRADKKHKMLEQQVFETAKKITIASPTWGKDLEKIGAKNVDVIYWGYDEDDFKGIVKQNNKKFSVAHVGLLGFDRNPETFLKVLSDLTQENERFRQSLKINLAGVVDYNVKQSINRLGLDAYVKYYGVIERPKALQLIVNASILFLPLNKAKNAKGRIPGKLFECLRTYNFLLVLGPHNSDVEKIVLKHKAGKGFEYDDYDGIKKYILSIFNNNKKNKTQNIEDFEVKNQVSRLSVFLDQITTSHEPKI